MVQLLIANAAIVNHRVWAIGAPPLGEEAHAVPGDRPDSEAPEERTEILDGVGMRVEAEPVDLTSGVEHDQRGLPVTLEGPGAARASSRSW